MTYLLIHNSRVIGFFHNRHNAESSLSRFCRLYGDNKDEYKIAIASK